MTKDDQRLMGGAVLYMMLFLCIAGILHTCGTAQASATSKNRSSKTSSPMTDELALARISVRESGTRAYLRDDMQAIDAVLTWRAENIYHSSFLDAARRYTRQSFMMPGFPRPWIVQLLPSAAVPAAFPSNTRWEGRHQTWWRRTYTRSIDTRRGEVRHRCNSQPHHWGAEQIASQFETRNPRAERLECGDTCSRRSDGTPRVDRNGIAICNVFYSIPRFETRFGPTK